MENTAVFFDDFYRTDIAFITCDENLAKAEYFSDVIKGQSEHLRPIASSPLILANAIADVTSEAEEEVGQVVTNRDFADELLSLNKPQIRSTNPAIW